MAEVFLHDWRASVLAVDADLEIKVGCSRWDPTPRPPCSPHEASSRSAALINVTFFFAHRSKPHYYFSFPPFSAADLCSFFFCGGALTVARPIVQQPGWRQHSDESFAGAMRRGAALLLSLLSAEQRALWQRVFFQINKSCTVYTWKFHWGPWTCLLFCSSSIYRSADDFFFWFKFLNFKKKKIKVYSTGAEHLHILQSV